ncbi:TonB-dependent receptor [Nitrospirillum viridazoti]|uniref:Iron complex outermembrane receptor protein n=1 Tax=Nitrospirillum amazonense TaxID=28077 RepID=A0A560HKC3_9PROT|nr:TonB-dependent receptor [Nitrospirillum amazonense]TWB46953.1 iron complex outermembrane receptor protein [Nitrospirillum amazonense]
MKRFRGAAHVGATLVMLLPPAAYAATDVPPAGSGAGEQASPDGLAEIIVTAERRSSTAQKTPATINVLSGDDLTQRGVGSLDDALSGVPGVALQANNKGMNINIRGVGTSLDSTAGDPGVNTNLDGVYLRQASTIVSGLFDVARIEVLKGPQGTLYGRNATGGVVNILTSDPEPEFGYRGSLTLGDYDLVRSEAALNVPVSSDVAIRAAFGSESHAGYLDTGQEDADRVAGRVKVLWTPNETLRVLTGFSFAHDGGEGPGSVYVTEPEGSRHAVVTHEPAGSLDQKLLTAYSTIEWDPGPVRVTFIPTYSHYAYNYLGTNYGFYSQQRSREDQGTAELRLSSPIDSNIQWVTGLYYYHDQLGSYANLIDNGIVNDQPDILTRSYAAFGDATIPITDTLRLSGGVRYTKDDRTQSGTLVTGGGTTLGPFGGELTSNATNFRVGLQYDVTPRSMLYATYATGYKAGGFVPDEPGYNTYKPEKLRSFEAGIKSRFFDSRLQLNISGFYYSYDNYQTSDLGLAHYGGLSALVFNSQGTTTIYGGEIQLSYRPWSSDQFDLALSPTKSKFGTFIIPATPVSALVNVTGLELPDTPALSGSVGYQHTWQMGSGTLTGRVETFFSTAYWLEFTHAPYSNRPGYTRTDLNLTYGSEDDRWSVGVFLRNAENSWIVTQKANTAVGDYGIQPPRTYGLTLSFRS